MCQRNGRVLPALSSCPSAERGLSAAGRPAIVDGGFGVRERHARLLIPEPRLLLVAGFASLPEELFTLPDGCVTRFLALRSPVFSEEVSLKQKQGPHRAAIEIPNGRSKMGE